MDDLQRLKKITKHIEYKISVDEDIIKILDMKKSEIICSLNNEIMMWIKYHYDDKDYFEMVIEGIREIGGINKFSKKIEGFAKFWGLKFEKVE